jgi:6-phosphofructokinase
MIAGTGANLAVDAGSKTTSDLIMIVGVVGRKGSHITLMNCSKKTTSDLLMICRVYPNNITLNFNE